MTPTSPALMRHSLLLALLSGLAGCSSLQQGTATALPSHSPVEALLAQRADVASTASPAATSATPAKAATPVSAPAAATAESPQEPRFDLIVNNAPAREVFLALVADSRYNMLTHPEVTGNLSVTLRRVTLREALEAIREVHGYDFRIEGRRIVVLPPTLQTRVFTVNYLHSQRTGRSEVRVSSGSAPSNNNGNGNGTGTPGGSAGNPPDSTQLTTQSRNDLWAELGDALRAMVGSTQGRSVVISPQSGMVAVRAMPDELRQVESFLAATRQAIERQVMLDVKIVQVELREGFQSGIDWSVLRGRGAMGSLGGAGSGSPLLANTNGLPTLPAGVLGTDQLNLPGGAGGVFGLSLSTDGFQSVLGFLETHGDVQTLSSPRLAALNNQKAVLKVGTDDYFVTNVSGGSVNTASSNSAGSTTLPTLALTPFFSGIALDVTPQIDEGHMITLHIHPSVSSVSERAKQVDLGTLGSYKLPLASSSINETDTVVRIPDGQIVAIGGLMEHTASRQTSGLPGSANNAITASLLGNRANSGRKKELVVLIKPSIIRSADDWQRQTEASWAALADPQSPVRVIRVDGPALVGRSETPAPANALASPNAADPNPRPPAATSIAPAANPKVEAPGTPTAAAPAGGPTDATTAGSAGKARATATRRHTPAPPPTTTPPARPVANSVVRKPAAAPALWLPTAAGLESTPLTGWPTRPDAQSTGSTARRGML